VTETTSHRSDDWSGLVGDVVAGRWIDPRSGQPLRVQTRAVAIAPTLAGREADLVAPLGLGRRLAVVSGPSTYEAMGRRVEQALRSIATIDSVVLQRSLNDEATVAIVMDRARHAEGLIAVGGGAISDLCKLAAARSGREFAMFPTSPATNGYTTASVSLTLASGLKATLSAAPPAGLFIDLGVNAASPPRLLAAGLGDNLSRFSAQVDWWVSHRLRDTAYLPTPYSLQAADEGPQLAMAAELRQGQIEAVASLVRVATLSGFGVALAGATFPGSMSEHAVSHYLDMFARPHPGSLHGEQVGLASVQMTRLQAEILLADAPPKLAATRIDAAAMERRYGAEVARSLLAEHRKKALLDQAAADAMNERLEAVWPELRAEVAAMLAPWQALEQALLDAGGHRTAAGYGIPAPLWREAVLHAREMRNRFTILDIADDAGLLEPFLDRL
jgi:glycerol-1-phosphate dehydrogenase [NAD(P)+]